MSLYIGLSGLLNVPGLTKTDSLVETHDGIREGTTDLLVQRFAHTHDVHAFPEQVRRASDAPPGLPLSGAEAIALLTKNDVEVILTDQRMPGMPGDVLLRQARELKPDTIRMLFTGYADIQAVINAVNEGHIFRYILKPWDSAELEGIIRQGVEQHDLLAERRAWKALFDHYVFREAGHPLAHLAEAQHGILGPLKQNYGRIRARVMQLMRG